MRCRPPTAGCRTQPCQELLTVFALTLVGEFISEAATLTATVNHQELHVHEAADVVLELGVPEAQMLS